MNNLKTNVIWSDSLDFSSVEMIDHTADMGLRVIASSMEQAFVLMAQALTEVSLDRDRIQIEEERTFVVQASDHPALLVRYLNEVLYFLAIGFLGKEYGVHISKADNQNIYTASGLMLGENYNAKRHRLYHEIKKATYHGLKFKPQNGKWIAEVIFDM